ncbi:Dothistromin biosynthesis peroxidase dotB [Fulvia fulva]|uniref:Dothistromin biosynthesis peroxidase dotB n=1 Tax=Passalora fulva TaxID=5499 RepID=A0A9Q8P8X1_PASFU|nr:Dothistromin biosynthesis peroxidase dotB [Fulvia fulva]KAK4625531.1 Dothistromin biosynthesis peroxidase dotB [Fulvia fulva]UJO17685.1 Dothistromin biosynthesis peroxidase dotB [Fulvia fulva]
MATTKSLLATLLATCVTAFPQASSAITPEVQNQLQSIGQDAVAALKDSSSPSNIFDAELQKVGVDGLHAFKPPGPFDERGPCPGLNALANHGYLPRSEFATLPQFIAAATSVYGMGIGLATILAAYGGLFDGIVVGWSIGGKEFTGIAGSHNNYEGDSSPTRGDLYQHGTNSDLILSQFKELLDRQPDPATANYNTDVIVEHRAVRYNKIVAKIPWFYYGPFTSFFSNHSTEFPEGILIQDVIKSFFAISGNNDNLKWYRRAMNDPYSFSRAGEDVNKISTTRYPYTTPTGCNMGTVNSFTPLDTFNTSLAEYDFSKPTDSVCYAIALVGTVLDNFPLVSVLDALLLLPFQNALDCPTLPAVDQSVGKACPGYSFRGGPTAPIAPGAIP